MVPVKTNSNWLPSIFNDFFENEWLAKTGVTAPAINVIENDKDYKVEMAAPGMTKDDFNGQNPVFDFCGDLILLHIFRQQDGLLELGI